jgi:RNA polymerase sigma-70 factor (ECF subfamily)
VVNHARRVGGTSAAEDVTQEVFLALWRDPDRFDPSRGSLRTYLLSLAQHRSIDLYRSEQSRRRRQDGYSPQAPPEASPDDAVMAAEVSAFVRSALARLPPTERVAIDLAYFGHHTYREVASLLNQPEGTVKSRIRHGLQSLRAAPRFGAALALASDR